MLVWVASYPRSGNTFLRIVMHQLYGVRTSTIYDFDGVAERLDAEMIGFEERPASLADMRASKQVHFVKTHRPRDADADERDRAICLVRDGRDSLVSWARMEAEKPGRDFRSEALWMINRDDRQGTASWGRNVLSWSQPSAPHRVVLRYENLVSDPSGEVERVMNELVPHLRPTAGASVPSFAELQGVDHGFFRRGRTGSHRDELPADLHRLFWSRPDNVRAMAQLGYGVPPTP